MSSFQQIEKTQHFDWGTILWFFEPDNLEIERLSIGLVTINPKSVHEQHLHSGDEQVIYVVSGEGRQTINGQTDMFEAGDIKHIPPYASHTMVNMGSDVLKLIIVYTPSKFHPLLTQNDIQIKVNDWDLQVLLDDAVLGQLLNKLSNALDLSLMVIDANGQQVITTDNYPVFCRMLATASHEQHCKECLSQAYRELLLLNKPHLHICCHDIVSIIVPIYTGDAVIGYIKCGQVFLSKPEMQEVESRINEIAAKYNLDYDNLLNVYLQIKIEPKSRLYTAAEAMLAIATYITDTALEALRKKELHNSKISLIKEQMARAELKRALYESNLKLLQSQINPHFLFNTLNTIAQMAYLDGAEKVAGLVWNLSDLLRVTLGKTEQRIPLREELKLLENYLSIQLIRYGDRLSVRKDIDMASGDMLVPCMLLQPLVENAIIHGLEQRTEKGMLKITIRLTDNKVAIHISDNGLGFEPSAYSINQNNKIGIKSVKARLQYCYGDDYDFTITSKPGEGTQVRMLLPILKGELS